MAAQTCLRPGPTSKTQETYPPSASSDTHGIHLPPGPSTAFPILTFTQPGGGLVNKTDVSNRLQKCMIIPFRAQIIQQQFDDIKATSAHLPSGRHNRAGVATGPHGARDRARLRLRKALKKITKKQLVMEISALVSNSSNSNQIPLIGEVYSTRSGQSASLSFPRAIFRHSSDYYLVWPG